MSDSTTPHTLMARAAVRDRQPGAEPGSVDSPAQRVLVAEPIAESGIELLRREFDVELGFELGQDELGERIGEFDALLIRSGTKVTAELIARAQRLKVIGRAGTGVDNVDVEAATKRGIIVAQRAMAFGMEVVAYDKFVAAERFRELGIEGVGSTEELYRRADIITIHLPRTAETVNWIDAEAISRMKTGVMIINAARGELVDLEALEEGLESGKVSGAALDVFPQEPMTEHPLFGRRDVVVTPHLGAATEEAQDRAGVITAEQVRAALAGGVVTNAVNIYAVRREAMEALSPFVPLCEKLGRLAQGLGNGSIH